METGLEGRITQLIQNELVAGSCELFGLKIYRAGRRQVVSLAIDRIEGGITLEECVRWNQRFSDLIEGAGIFADAYVVEVSSPGADWPLHTERDYRRVLNRRLFVRYRQGDVQTQEARGTLKHVGGGSIALAGGASEAPQVIAIEAVVEAKIEFLNPKD